ncbi:MAG: hypothetical protein MHM6MM_005063 [Cercozoa sp. M6MM]
MSESGPPRKRLRLRRKGDVATASMARAATEKTIPRPSTGQRKFRLKKRPLTEPTQRKGGLRIKARPKKERRRFVAPTEQQKREWPGGFPQQLPPPHAQAEGHWRRVEDIVADICFGRNGSDDRDSDDFFLRHVRRFPARASVGMRIGLLPLGAGAIWRGRIVAARPKTAASERDFNWLQIDPEAQGNETGGIDAHNARIVQRVQQQLHRRGHKWLSGHPLRPYLNEQGECCADPVPEAALSQSLEFLVVHAEYEHFGGDFDDFEVLASLPSSAVQACRKGALRVLDFDICDAFVDRVAYEETAPEAGRIWLYKAGIAEWRSGCASVRGGEFNLELDDGSDMKLSDSSLLDWGLLPPIRVQSGFRPEAEALLFAPSGTEEELPLEIQPLSELRDRRDAITQLFLEKRLGPEADLEASESANSSRLESRDDSGAAEPLAESSPGSESFTTGEQAEAESASTSVSVSVITEEESAPMSAQDDEI